MDNVQVTTRALTEALNKAWAERDDARMQRDDAQRRATEFASMLQDAERERAALEAERDDLHEQAAAARFDRDDMRDALKSAERQVNKLRGMLEDRRKEVQALHRVLADTRDRLEAERTATARAQADAALQRQSRNAVADARDGLLARLDALAWVEHADRATVNHTAFGSFGAMLYAGHNYRPTLRGAPALADLYDAVQALRGDDRRAYRGK